MKPWNNHFLKNEMTLSSRLSIGLANQNKKNAVSEFVLEFQRLVSFYVFYLWTEFHEKNMRIPTKFRAEQRPPVSSWVLERVKILAIQQASGLVQGVSKHVKYQKKALEKLEKEYENDRSLELYKEILATRRGLAKMNKVPRAKDPYCCLSSKVISLEKSEDTSFDYWITLHDFDSRTKGKKIRLPVKGHRHFNKMVRVSKETLGGIVLREHSVQVSFKFQMEPKEAGETVGLDIGDNTLFYISNPDGSICLSEDKTLREKRYKDLNAKVSRKKRDSKAQRRAQMERKNYINEQLNRLDMEEIAVLRREKLYNFRYWRYNYIFDSVDRFCFLRNVFVEEVNPRHTSQRCSFCGWTSCKNRNGEKFRCQHCGAVLNADENSSRNVSNPRLASLGRSDSDSQIGYFWPENAGSSQGNALALGSPEAIKT